VAKRRCGLRMPLQHSVRPAEPYVGFLATVRAIETTPERLAAIYDALLPAIAQRQRRYVEHTDKLVDAPTVRILDRFLSDTARMIDSAHALRREMPALQLADRQWISNLQTREAASELLAPIAAQAAA